MISVLVVDDSKFIAKALSSLLEQVGFNVAGLAHDGIEGIQKYELYRPDVMLLDVTMPNMDGIDCLTRIREIDCDARIVMLSAIQDPATIDRCLTLGAANFLQKPIRKDCPADICRLCETLQEAVEKVV